jgi:hypothetical protein
MKQGPWTDIYSLSAVIYFAIVKSAPPTSVARMLKDPIVALQDGQHSGFSKEFLAAIDKGLAVKPDERPQSIEEFRKLLDLELSVPMPMPDNDATGPIVSHRASHKPGERSDKKPNGKQAEAASGKQINHKRGALSSNLLDAPLTSRAWWTVAAASVAVLALGSYLWLKPVQPPATPPTVASTHAHAAPAKAAIAALAPVPKITAAEAASEKILDEETIGWESLKQQSNVTPQQINAFLQKYPNSPHAEAARVRLAELQGKNTENKTAATATATAAAKPADIKGADAKAADPTGVVLLTIKPWGNVLVDGSMKGASPPLKKLVLAEGKHQIKVVNPSFPDRVFEIDVNSKKSRNIDYDFSSH